MRIFYGVVLIVRLGGMYWVWIASGYTTICYNVLLRLVQR